jgi:PAS domain S-box-containing protein
VADDLAAADLHRAQRAILHGRVGLPRCHESLAREHSLAEAEQRFRTIFSMAPIGKGIARDGYVMRANQAWADVVGRSPAQPRDARSTTSPSPVTRRRSKRRGSYGDGGRPSYRVETRYLHVEGHAVRVQVDLSAVRDAAGAIQYVMVQVQDIAERRRHQQQLEHIANHDALRAAQPPGLPAGARGSRAPCEPLRAEAVRRRRRRRSRRLSSRRVHMPTRG